MAIRFLGLTDEQRLAIEETTGIRTEGAQMIVESAVEQANIMMQSAIREIQEVVGPHGSVTRLQAGGVRITPGIGMGVFEDGVLKTTIEPDGDFLVGSDINQPATTTFAVFVNEQIYNNELMGAGDLLIGDNSTDTSNIKYDASEGQLQFRLGTTVNVYMDTDGSLKAGAGLVVLDADGITLEMGSTDENQIKWVNEGVYRAVIYAFTSINVDTLYVSVGDGVATRSAYIGITAVAPNTNSSDIHMESGFGSSRNAAIRVSSPVSPAQPIIKINYWGFDVDTQILGSTDDNLLYADASTDRIGIKKNNPGYALDVNGDVNVASGSNFKINGTNIAGQTTEEIQDIVGAMFSSNTETGITVTYQDADGTIDVELQSAAETNTNDIFRCDSPGGVSAFAGTIATLPGGAVLTYNVSSGQEGAMVPQSTSALAKMRLYNTTRGTSALISNCVVGTNTITLTANVPVGWAVTDVITIASQTVSGGSTSWVDLEITSGPTGKTDVWFVLGIVSATAGDILRAHQLTTYATSKVKQVIAQATNIPNELPRLFIITSNVFSIGWTGTPTIVYIREEGYLK